jgi:repressor LexA
LRGITAVRAARIGAAIAAPALLANSLEKTRVLYKNTDFGHVDTEPPMRDLTARQQQILALIRQHIAGTGFPPTRAEIAAQLGFRSPNAAEEHLKALARKGVIELASGSSRGIRLKLLPDSTDEAPRAVQIALSLPLVGRVAAGSPILAQEHIEASYAIDPNLFDDKPDYLLKVRGMSMRDAGIFDGDLLAVRRADEARNGQVVVARVGDDVTVKRWRRKGHTIELLPENPDFEPIVVDSRSDAFALEGIAVGLLRGGKAL